MGRYLIFILFFICCKNTNISNLKLISEEEVYISILNEYVINKKCDSITIALDFPDFKIFEGDFYPEVFDYTSFENLHNFNEKYIDTEIVMNNYSKKLNCNSIDFIRFIDCINDSICLEKNNKVIHIFSPLYFDSLQNFGIVLLSKYYNYKKYTTKVIYLEKYESSYYISGFYTLHGFVPLEEKYYNKDLN